MDVHGHDPLRAHGLEDFGFQYEPVADVGGQPRNVVVLTRAQVEVSTRGVFRAGARQEVLQQLEGVLAGRLPGRSLVHSSRLGKNGRRKRRPQQTETEGSGEVKTVSFR